MTPRHRLTSRAEADLRDIWLYIAADSVDAADRMVDRFTETFETLVKHPEVGTPMEQFRSGLRCFSVGGYVVFYTGTDEGIEVFRVLHGSRHFEDLL